MSLEKIFTIEDLISVAKTTLSEKRFLHSKGVAETTEMLLTHYNCTNYVKDCCGFSAGLFCGYAHDLGRELSNEDIIRYCENNNLHLTSAMRENPVLAHGTVSANIVKNLFESCPQSWLNAIICHTVGCSEMDDLAMAVFIADFIEPSRTYLSEERRQSYLNAPDIQSCMRAVLSDMIAHWKEKGYHTYTMYINTSKPMLDLLGMTDLDY